MLSQEGDEPWGGGYTGDSKAQRVESLPDERSP